MEFDVYQTAIGMCCDNQTKKVELLQSAQVGGHGQIAAVKYTI
jgi:hypothetical protein